MRTYLVTIKHAGQAIFELVHASDGFAAAIAAQQRHPQACGFVVKQIAALLDLREAA